MMGKATIARGGTGAVSKARKARGEISKMVTKPADQPPVDSNIPNAGPAGVPPAEADKMADLARQGNNADARKVIAVERGETAYGPKVVSSVARSGGQVGVAPGQFGAWARPTRV